MTVATESCLHELIEAQALRTPDAIAVACGEQQLTYAALDGRANVLARGLVELDVEPDCRVGVYFTHSVDMVVALLAVLKAGGAYIPLDPGFPADRVQQALGDASVTAVVTTAALQAKLPPTPAGVLRLEDVLTRHQDASNARIALKRGSRGPAGPDASNARIALERLKRSYGTFRASRVGRRPERGSRGPAGPDSTAQSGLGHRASIDNLAYVMYTSGSTGRPKGVLIPHRSVVEGYFAWDEAYRLRSNARVHCQMGSFAFGVFHLDFVRALCSGAKLVLCEPVVVMDPPRLYEVMTWHHVDFAEFVPAALRGLVRYCRATSRSLEFLNTLIVGSDRWYMAEHRALRSLCHPGARIIHSFGLTETGDTAYFEGSELDLPDGQLVPIGRPFPNINAYVLDEHLDPVPNGQVGELFIGGSGIARGISNRPDLTAEKFVPDPFADRPGARMYRTGDQARVLPDGNIEFLGRLDQMVKVRGFRVEPGEIEVVLKAHPAVADAVVMPREDQSGATGLVAYVVPSDGRAATVTDLREHLRTRLPDYMMPASFVRLERLPLTPSGKVDRLALPAPTRGRPDLGHPFIAPRDAREDAVAHVFADTLGVDEIGAEDNFFELGGHSLLAAMAAARLAETLNVDLRVRDVFDFPRVAGLAARIAALGPASAEGSAGPTRQPRSHRGLPLSFAQQRLWFLDQLQRDSSLYNELTASPFTGELDTAALARSLNEMQRRHEILRTTFELEDDGPVQVIGPVADLPLEVIDLTGERDQERAAIEHCLKEGQRPFDLRTGPLWRASLLKFGPAEHWLLLSMHHIITDEWSIDVLKRELQTLYRSFRAGEPSPLPEPTLQYADYAVWQRERLTEEVRRRELAYWTAQLNGAPEVVPLPTDRPRPRVASYRGANQSRLLPAHLPPALRELGQRDGASLFMTVLAVFYVLLHRHTGETDLVVGSPVANRTPPVEGLLGFFLNTLVLRAKVSGSETFRALLRRVREITLNAFDHQELPFEKLVEELQPERALSHNPLFQVLFANQQTADPIPTPAWLPFSWMAKFDIALFLRDAGDQVGLTCEYSTDLFDDATITRLLDHLVVLLEAVVVDPEQRVADLPLIPPGERQRLLLEWNETAAAYRGDACVHELFEMQVRRRADAVALRHGDISISYRELNRRANQLAHYLRRLGVGPDVPVGLCLERSPQLVVGVLAVLKAGGAYLPLDASYPPKRLAFMLADARVPVVVTQTDLEASLPEVAAQVVCIDRDEALIAGQRDTEPQADVNPQNLAYIIYTSGSTGTPKGIAMPHQPLVNLIAWQTERSDLRTPRTTLQFSPISFDVSFQEVFSTLCSGAALVLVDEERRRDARQLARYISTLGVERLFIPVAMLHQLAELADVDQAHLRSVREIITAGEQLQVTEPVRAMFERLPSTTLHNHYGPTETHVITAHHVGGLPRDWPSAPPIGRPIRNAKTYVLDARLEPVPIGVVGDLYLGGDPVCRGYLGQPDLTADRFIPDPFTPVGGARLYRTGDRARFRNDGTLEFLGRLDDQVKVRGFRIELNEIEAVLSQHPGVHECAVTVLGEGISERRLVAYVTLAPASKASAAQLMGFLKERLPDYMVPSTIVELDRLPLTPSGKIDRRALPAPDRRRPDLSGGFAGPVTDVERTIVEVWGDVLDIERVGVNDNFFDLGGHSLLATITVSRLRSRLGVDLGVRDLFEAPTPRELAHRVAALSPANRPVDDAPLVRHRFEGLVPASFAQERVWFLDQSAPHAALYNQTDIHPIAGPLDRAALQRALTELVRRHESLRTTFQLVEGRPMQVIGAATSDPLDVIDFSQEADPGIAATAYAVDEGQRPFDLARGPLVRAVVMRLGPEQHQVLLTLHHIITDGWSIDLLRRELQTLYDAFKAGQPSPLPEPALQYADFVIWQRARMNAPHMAQELAYWTRQLKGAPFEVRLPTDRPRPSLPSHRGATQSRLVSARLAPQLDELGRAQGTSLFMILVAAFSALLHGYSGERDLVIGSAVANRNRPELEGLLGVLTNLIVLRTEVIGAERFEQLLARVRRVTLEAYEHQELVYEKVVEALQPERARSFIPLFNVVFAHNALEPTPPADRDARVSPAPGPDPDSMIVPSASRYDLILATASAPTGFRISFDYSRDLFDDGTVTRMLDNLMMVLEAVAEDPRRTIDALPVLIPARSGA